MATKTFKVSLSLDNPRIIQSGINVRSFDKQSIKIAIELTKNSQVYQIPTGAQIKISLLKLARQEQKIILDVPFTSADSIDWVVPDYLDGYQGEVRVGIYLIVGTENIDVGYFNITSSVSDIDKASEEFTDSVMQGWDQIEADLAEIRATITQVNTLASDFTTDVATKQADVTSKYNAFDTSVTQANQTIDDILALQPQFQSVIDETTGKDVISAPEVILARGGASTLGARLDEEKAEVSAQLAQNLNEVKRLDAIKANLTDLGAPTQAQVDDWLSRNPDSTSTVVDNSLTTSKYIDNSVKKRKTSFFEHSGKNLADVESYIHGSYVSPTTGVVTVSSTYALYSTIKLDGLVPLDTYTSNTSIRILAFYDVKGDFLSSMQSSGSATGIPMPIVIPENAVSAVAALRNALSSIDLSTFQFEAGSISTPYEDYWQFIGKLKKRSIKAEDIAEGVIPSTSGGNHQYIGADGVIAGDSIVWNTGQVINGETLIGYDGVLMRDLQLNSLLNIGVSGRPMADGTANGAGTHTTVTTAGIDWLTKKFWACNAGTNDFKLNVPIGTIQPFGSAFDKSTYIGAYQATIEYLLTKKPNLEIIIFTPAQRNNGGYTTESTNTVGHKLIDYANAAKEIATKYSGLPVDIYGESGINQFAINQDTYDGLHLNNSGYEKAGGLAVKKMIYG